MIKYMVCEQAHCDLNYKLQIVSNLTKYILNAKDGKLPL